MSTYNRQEQDYLLSTLVEGYEDENWSRIKGVIDERKTDGKMITVLAYIGV